MLSVARCSSCNEWVIRSWWEQDQLELFETGEPGPADEAHAMTWATVQLVIRAVLNRQERVINGFRFVRRWSSRLE